jgi:large subunit ribosomal protein L35
MPKIKTKRSAAKRIRATGTGKLMRSKGWKKHLLEWKPSKRKRHLRKATEIAPGDEKRIRRLVPYL